MGGNRFLEDGFAGLSAHRRVPLAHVEDEHSFGVARNRAFDGQSIAPGIFRIERPQCRVRQTTPLVRMRPL